MNAYNIIIIGYSGLLHKLSLDGHDFQNDSKNVPRYVFQQLYGGWPEYSPDSLNSQPCPSREFNAILKHPQHVMKHNIPICSLPAIVFSSK